MDVHRWFPLATGRPFDNHLTCAQPQVGEEMPLPGCWLISTVTCRVVHRMDRLPSAGFWWHCTLAHILYALFALHALVRFGWIWFWLCECLHLFVNVTCLKSVLDCRVRMHQSQENLGLKLVDCIMYCIILGRGIYSDDLLKNKTVPI